MVIFRISLFEFYSPILKQHLMVYQEVIPSICNSKLSTLKLGELRASRGGGLGESVYDEWD